MRQGGMLCPLTVGRDLELHQLSLELDEARLGRGRVSVVAGEPGVGKSRLASELQRVAQGLGMRVLCGRAVESGSPVPYRVLAAAVLPSFRATGPPDDPRLGPYRSALSVVVPEWDDGSHPLTGNSQLAALEATGRLLGVLAGSTGLLLVLEDVHWADAETLAAVDYLVDTLSTERVLCLATLRPGETAAARDLVTHVESNAAASLLQLDRLRSTDLGSLLRATLATAKLPDGLAGFIETNSEGLPLAAEELLADLVASGQLTATGAEWAFTARDDARAPAGFRRLVERRVARLTPEARLLLKGASMLGREFDWTMLPGITGLSDATALASLGEAVEAQLLSTVGGATSLQFRHALIRAAIEDALLPPECSQLARAAAKVVEAAPGATTPERLELAASLWQRGGENASAARLLVRLGADALQRGALTSAEATLDRAVQLSCDQPEIHAGAMELLSDTLYRAGAMERCLAVTESLPDELLRIGADADRVHACWLRVARAAIGHAAAQGVREIEAIDRGGMEVAERALDIADETRTDPAGRAATGALRALMAIEKNEYEQARSRALDNIDLADSSGACAALCESLYVLARVVRASSAEEALAPLERALLVAERNRLHEWRLRILLELGLVDRSIGSRTDRLVQARDLARDSGALLTAAIAGVNLGHPVETDQVHWTWDDAAPCLAEALELSRRHCLPTLNMALRFDSMYRSLRGDRAAFDRDVAEIKRLMAEAGAATLGFQFFWWAVANEDWALALKTLDDVAAEVANPAGATAPTRGLFLLICALTDRDGEGELARARALGWATSVNRGLGGLAEAVIVGRLGRGTDAVRIRVESLDLIDSADLKHIGNRLVAEAAMRDGWGEPAAWLRESLAFFDANAMQQPARACRSLLRELGEPVSRRGRGDSAVPDRLRACGVTSREMDVLALVQEGLTNAEIAARLFMSRRTVETHVSRLLMKTGVPNRGRLARLKDAT